MHKLSILLNKINILNYIRYPPSIYFLSFSLVFGSLQYLSNSSSSFLLSYLYHAINAGNPIGINPVINPNPAPLIIALILLIYGSPAKL